jgi:hypothetical protein
MAIFVLNPDTGSELVARELERPCVEEQLAQTEYYGCWRGFPCRPTIVPKPRPRSKNEPRD